MNSWKFKEKQFWLCKSFRYSTPTMAFIMFFTLCFLKWHEKIWENMELYILICVFNKFGLLDRVKGFGICKEDVCWFWEMILEGKRNKKKLKKAEGIQLLQANDRKQLLGTEQRKTQSRRHRLHRYWKRKRKRSNRRKRKRSNRRNRSRRTIKKKKWKQKELSANLGRYTIIFL